MHLTFVLWTGVLGGAETLSLEWVRHLRAIGHEASLLIVGSPSPLDERASQQGIPVVSLGLGRGALLFPLARRYAAAVKSLGPDVAVVMRNGYLTYLLRLGGFTGPIVAVEHGALLRYGASRRLSRRAARLDRALAARHTNAEVAVSDFMLRQVALGPHHERLVRIYNGVDPDRFTIPEEELGGPFRFGCAARLIPGKGIDVAINALARSVYPGTALHIAGVGPERPRLEHLAATLGLGDRVVFLGRVHDMPRFWQSVHVGVAASDTLVESFGMSGLEAMACGRPIIVSDLGGLAEVPVDEQTGKIVPAGDVAALAAAMDRYAGSPALWLCHGRAARARSVEEFSLDACVRGYLRLCDTLSKPVAG
jgi:glycosyltransferase involved in cell wall biosynthesis